MPQKFRPLWKCPKCWARLVTRNMWHSCGRFSLKELFSRSEPHVLRLFRKYARMVRKCGPVRMIPQKTRVVFMVRVRFASAYPQKSHLECGIALSRRYEDKRFTKIESYAQRFHGHMFHVRSEKDLDAKIQRWLRESYRVGAQLTLESRSKKA